MTQQLNDFAVCKQLQNTVICIATYQLSISPAAEKSIVYHNSCKINEREGDLRDDFLDGAYVGKLFSSLIKKSTNFRSHKYQEPLL